MASECKDDPQEREDARVHPRHIVHEKASIWVLGRERRVRCEVLDLSLGGCRLLLPEPVDMSPGMEVEGTFRIRGAPLRLLGTICWTNTRGMIGIRFGAMSARCREILQEAVAEIGSQKLRLIHAAREEEKERPRS